MIAETSYTDDLAAAGGAEEYAGVALLFYGWFGRPVAEVAAELDGRALVLSVEVTDAGGRGASASVAVVGDCCN
jgi:hypothetical protein